ncbi:unnamed protein product [Parajaminaea phylloscopi]
MSTVNTSSPSGTRSNSIRQVLEIDEDLGLDLPFHLTEALQRNAHTAKASQADHEDDPFTDTHGISSHLAASLWDRAKSPVPTVTVDAGSGNLSPSHRIAQHIRDKDDAAQQDPRLELDQEMVGALAREELEALLYHANAVIRERERDLGIAAAIGQALLQKNITLRSKHQHVMTRLALDAGDDDGDDDGEDDENREPARCSPPTNDTDSTPMAAQFQIQRDYFSEREPSTMATAAQHQTPLKTRTPLSQVFGQGSFVGFGDSSHRLAGLVPSAPSSPGALSFSGDSTTSCRTSETSKYARRVRHRQTSSLHASETQKQLSSLSAQNEALLAQLAELQDEAEDAKREGGKRLRKLDREIEGLQQELEAATQRNVELEREQELGQAGHASASRLESPLRRGRERERLPPSPPALAAGNYASLANSASISRGLDALLQDPPGQLDPQQRDVILRLMDKMKELEATNAVLEREKKEREGRLGAALERGVRISDEYDAVLQAHDSELLSATVKEPEMTSADSSPLAPRTSSASSSPQRRKRAIGNRVQVEGRKTIRKAIQTHRSTEIWGGSSPERSSKIPTSSTASSISSYLYGSSVSASSSGLSMFSSSQEAGKRRPRRVRSALALNRPRILITPSMEDMAARRKEQQDGWEDVAVAGNVDPPMLSARDRSNSLDPSDAEKIASYHRLLSSSRQASEMDLGRRGSSASTDSTLTHLPEDRKQSPPSGGGSPYQRYLHQFSAATELLPGEHALYDDFSLAPASPSATRRRWRKGRPDEISKALARKESCERFGLKTLGSELGSVLGDSMHYQDDTGLPGQTQGNVDGLSPNHHRLRPAASSGSMRAPSEATSDIAHLKWPAQEREKSPSPLRVFRQDMSRRLAIGLGDRVPEVSEAAQEMSDMFSPDGQTHEDGDWLPTNSDRADEALLTPGGLRDRLEPDEDAYTSLHEAIRHRPVQWADDDDYGLPLKESEARRLGLAPSRSTMAIESAARHGSRTTGLSLLTWMTGAKKRGITAAWPRGTSSAAIQSSEQLEEEERAQAMLRGKYRLARNRRLGQAYDAHLNEADTNAAEDEERELEARFSSLVTTLSPERKKKAAISPAKNRGKAWYDRPLVPERRPSHTKEDEVRSDEQVKDIVGQFQGGNLVPSALGSQRIVSKRKQARTKAAEAVDDITAWVSLVFVLILAFFVSASRGPKRILGTGDAAGIDEGGHRRGVRGTDYLDDGKARRRPALTQRHQSARESVRPRRGTTTTAASDPVLSPSHRIARGSGSASASGSGSGSAAARSTTDAAMR